MTIEQIINEITGETLDTREGQISTIAAINPATESDDCKYGLVARYERVCLAHDEYEVTIHVSELDEEENWYYDLTTVTLTQIFTAAEIESMGFDY